jgi:hypothetical protein
LIFASALVLTLAACGAALIDAPIVSKIPAAASMPEPAPGPLQSQVEPDCNGADVRAPTRHRPGLRSPAVTEALRHRYCALRVGLAGGSTVDVEFAPQEFRLRLLDAPFAQLPAIVDSNSPAFWDESGVLHLFSSAWAETYRSSGDNVENLTEPVLVQLPVTDRPGTVWLEAIWRDPDDLTLYGWYHLEPSDLPCLTAPVIGAAVSYDDGLSWEDRGAVLDNGYPIDCDYNNGFFVGGNGDFSVVVGPGAQHFYFIFTNYAGPGDEQGIAVARGAYAGRGQPGTVAKYYQGAWSEPGIGGKATAIMRSSTGWSGPRVESFWGPSVHWNPFLGVYVALMNHTNGEFWAQEGIYIAFSYDLLAWTQPSKVLNSNDWYPQVIGLSPGATDSLAAQSMRLFVGGASTYVLEFEYDY